MDWMDKNVTVRHLVPRQREAWTFRLMTSHEGGGIISVPSRQEGYPIDWPPQIPAQGKWIEGFSSDLEQRAGSAWWAKPDLWVELVELLVGQAAAEKANQTR